MARRHPGFVLPPPERVEHSLLWFAAARCGRSVEDTKLAPDTSSLADGRDSPGSDCGSRPAFSPDLRTQLLRGRSRTRRCASSPLGLGV